MVKRREIIKAYVSIKDLRSDVRSISRQIARLEKELAHKADLLEWAMAVDKIVDGIPLSINGARVSDVSDEIPRWTDDYDNVRDGGVGLRFRVWLENGGYDDVATIMTQPARVAKERAIAWVVHGELPEGVKKGSVHLSV